MSNSTRVTGRFTIDPPLSWAEINGSPFASDNRRDSDLQLVIDEETVDTADGTLLRRTSAALVMREIDEYRADKLLAQVQKAVDDFPGHEWAGRLDCQGEYGPDMWRVYVRDGQAVRVEPRIVWPDDAD
ncbi:DUF6205 family protein [Streptomyces sp. NPDC059718]